MKVILRLLKYSMKNIFGIMMIQISSEYQVLYYLTFNIIYNLIKILLIALFLLLCNIILFLLLNNTII